ncbi:hypothetical protein B9Z55_028346 [Caenorhabditis nigoni]|uniref:BHLH domain-containing protein n=1 Tax=Caenorhabditis nigoni TaxID=1611254 RepID=A0A2G5SBV4_9PELO|nr:hypothetical protein B9Z55_028346 [Caenorhabditis nigoni]
MSTRQQLPNPTEAKLCKIETLKLANAYLESLKTMLNKREDTIVQPMATGPKRIKMEPEWIAQPVVVKQENVKSIKKEIGLPRAGRIWTYGASWRN